MKIVTKFSNVYQMFKILTLLGSLEAGDVKGVGEVGKAGEIEEAVEA